MLLKLFGHEVAFNVCCPACGSGAVDIEKKITNNRYQMHCKFCKKSFTIIKAGYVGQKVRNGKSGTN